VAVIPASYAFVIWGVIYVGLIAYGVYQLQRPQRQDYRILQANRYLMSACITQMLWIYLFTMQWFWASVVAMLGILGCLIQVYRILGIGAVTVGRRRQWLAHTPFSLYLGWISVATVVNIASALFSSGLQGNRVVWAIAILLIGGGLATGVIRQRLDAVFGLVFVWAYGAIAIRESIGAPVGITAMAIAIGLFILSMLTIRHGNKRDRQAMGPNAH